MIKRILSVLFALTLTFTSFALVSCRDGNEQTETQTDFVLMNGFENFDRDVQIIRIFNEFGKLDQNADLKYVRTGEKSLKLTPLGSRVHTANPYIMLPAFSTRYEEIAYGDFTKVDKVSMWFYNAEQTPVNVGIGFGKSALVMNTEIRRDEMRKTAVEYYTLSSGWNYVEYKVNHALLALQGLKITEVYGIVIECDYVTSHDLKDSPEIYLDDVCLKYAETEFSTKFSREVKTGTTEDGKPFWQICDFENPYESYYFYYNYKFPAPATAHPVIKTVFAGEYNVKTENGINVMMINKKHGGNFYGWPGLVMHGDVLLNVFSAIGEDIKNNPQNYEIKYDVYNGSNYQGGWTTEYYPEGYAWKNAKNETEDLLAVYQSVSVPAKTWKTVSYNIGKLNEKVLDERIPEGAGVKQFTENPTIKFQFSRYNTEEDLSDRPFFVDNFRIEKIQ